MLGTDFHNFIVKFHLLISYSGILTDMWKTLILYNAYPYERFVKGWVMGVVCNCVMYWRFRQSQLYRLRAIARDLVPGLVYLKLTGNNARVYSKVESLQQEFPMAGKWAYYLGGYSLALIAITEGCFHTWSGVTPCLPPGKSCPWGDTVVCGRI